MIATLRGSLLYSDENSVVIECGGVGFKCFTTKNTLYNLPAVGKELFLYTHLSVREDAMDIYGFSELEELNTFKLITSVNGVGAKIGIAILSELSSSQVILAIGSGDAKTLTMAQGVGIKLAQRIILELKDKVSNSQVSNSMSGVSVVPASSTPATSAGEAIEALVALGYTKSAASLAVGRLDSSLPADQLIKQALKVIARGL